uniref:[histone H3]-lysine(36) N-trimethyltransferase n=1 Tax=Scleropages formosus TaxID=113540 RepID=A0A8C9SF62_SCLFO
MDVKEESLSKPTLLKNLPTKGLLSSRLLPKGTKSKVNLEEHGRQKVSFSFSQTKKPLPNLFLSQLSPEKSPCDLQLPLLSSNNSQQGKLELKVESRNESTGLSFPTPVPESPLSVTSLPKSKLELGKMHFKKQLLSVSASFEKPVDEPKPTIKLEEVSSLQETVLKPATKITTEAAVSQIQLTFKDCISEEHVIGVLEENLNPSVKGSTDSSHIGTEIKEKFSGLEQADIPEQHKSQSQSDSTLPGSESDGDSVRTSSSHKSGDPRSMESEKLEKSSSYAKSDERVKEERCSTHSKSDRETRYSRSSRSDKERRRTKSRSRSRSRGSRTSSSYSRSERSSRNERLSRSDRSHYHDSERRSYRSPYRERRSSRSRSDRKSRDSSDSEDDYRRARTGSNRSSNHSSSHRDSKFFYSKSEKDVKCSEISRSSETEKRIQLHSRSERCPRKIEFESIRKTSPELESECRKSNAHCKLESNIKSPLSKSNICSQTIDKKPHKGHSSSDSEDDQKEKSKFIKLPPCSGLNDSQPAMSEKDFKVSLSKLIVTDAQVQDKLNNTELIQMQSHSNKYCPSSFEDGTQCQLNCLPSKHIDLSQSKDTAIPSKEMHHLSVPDPVSANDFVGQDCEEADSVNVTVSSGATLAPTYSLRSKSKPHKHNSSPPPKLLIVNTDSAQQCRSNQSLNKSSSVVCDTVLPDSCVSSETFTNEQDKEQLCKYGHTLPVVPVVLRKNETGVLSEPSRNSSPAVLSCQPYSKDNTSPGLSEESMMCVVSSERLSNLSGIEVLEGANVSSESNAHINDSIEVTNGFPSNRHVLQGHNSCEGEGHVESSIPVYRESIETKHYATAQLSSYSTCVLPDCSPPQISQKVCNPAEISIKELSLGDLQQKTKSEDICHGSLDETGSQSSVVPPKFESTKVSELSVASQQSEQLNIKTEQQSGTLLKNKINLKKSRWDIVGQDKSDHEHSLKMPCHETKPSVKKIISVKKIEFSKDSGLEHVKNFGTIKMNLNNETVLSKQHSVGKNHASLEDNSLKSPQNQLDAKTQLSMSTQSQPCDTSNTNVDICFDQNYKEPPRSSHATSRSVAKDWTRDSKTGGHDVLLDKLERRNTSINQDVGSHSDDSDSEESDSDSDDCSIPKNRLHSVVVVPKNSTLTQPHDSRATLTSFSSPTGSPHQLPADWQEQGWRGSSSKESNRAHDAYSEVSGTLSPVERQKGFSSQLPESSKHTLHVLCTERPILTGQQNVTYQSQSNMVDSTSHVEASHTFEAQQSKEQKSSTYQNPKISVPSSSVGSFHSFETMWRTSDPGQSRPCDRPDSWHDRKSILMHQQHGEFSSSDDLSNKDGYRWGWDIPQPEQPSSTFQQPDSSYGIHTPNPMLVGSPALGQMGQHSSGCWIQPTASQGCRPVYLSVPSLYRESLDEMHPDSLTNDYEEESQENHGTVTFCNHPPPASTSFVQGPEISSNCRGLGGVLDTPREDSQKPHRGRGPPKKRRPEFESDSENEAESENSIKRERLAEPDVSRTSKDPVDTPNQTAEVERPSLSLQDFQDPVRWKDMAKLKKMPPYFDLIEENMYLTERKKNKSHRDIKRMQCECAVLSREERARGATACGEDCLNRLLMIECSSRCLNGSYCSNRRFQMKQHADFEVILTENKGWGLRAAKDLAPNTFVLEYCGEVLDHKEFKARVKEYARSKNIHYYFMALKNNEIIDATLKGNCSRFMNHSCEPNCETQKWTVNGQLRVGFFTTKGVSAGTELTFDYQFQRYGKEAQKCLCGAPSCRGFLGGENRVSIRAAGGKMKKERSRKKDSVDEELEALLENGEGLSDEKEVISLCRLMVRVETMEQKLTCLKLIQNTQNPGCLKQFLDHHGLSLLWIFMVELSEAKGNSSNNIKLQLEIMRSLEVLPISTKNMLEESRVLHFIQRWAQNQTLPQAPELDGYSSENTSRAQTPLNTPDGPPAKLGPELDGETPKRAVYRRLKIISENSLDSAMSDASKASDGKEEEEEEEEDEEEDSLPKQEPAEVKEEAVETEVPGSAVPTAEAAATASTTTATDPVAVGTPSQDEEEGVSDVESERSQEPPIRAVDISDMAARLLDSWKDLKVCHSLQLCSCADSSQAAVTQPYRDLERTPRSTERRRRRSSHSPPLSAYERSSRRSDDRYEHPNSSKKKVRPKERNKLTTEERRKLFEQEVAQKEAQKQQQQQQQQQLQALPYEMLGYSPGPHGYMGYPPGYPIQTYVDPTNPNAGKVLLPTPSVEPLCAAGATVPYEQTPPQPLISELGLASPSSAPPSQTAPTAGVPHMATTLELAPGTAQYVQSRAPSQDSVTVLSAAPPTGGPQTQTQQGYTPVWSAAVPQPLTVQAQPAQPHTAIYYQGQACQAVYSIPTAYPQAGTPVIQTYAEPATGYIQGQPVYTAHQQGVVLQQAGTVTTIVTAPTVQQDLIAPNSLMDLPPPSPPKPKTIVLPPNWKVARDPEGKIYYYHVITRQTQWDPPCWEGGSDDASVGHEAEMDLGTPTYDENPSKFSTKTAEADTSSELAKKSKEVFRKEMSQFIVQCLNPYRKPDCKSGRISNTEDFKHLARKLTHGVMNKELKSCKNPEDLECNENVKHKTKEYIKKYMQKFGPVYRPKEDTEVD